MRVEFSTVRWSIGHYNHPILSRIDHAKMFSFFIILQKLVILTESWQTQTFSHLFSFQLRSSELCVCLFSKEKKLLKKISARNPALTQPFANNLLNKWPVRLVTHFLSEHWQYRIWIVHCITWRFAFQKNRVKVAMMCKLKSKHPDD